MAASQAIGSAGELIVQARLLVRGWIAGNVNSGGMRNAPAIDLVAMKGRRTCRIAVKSTGHGGTSVQWNLKPGWTTLFKGQELPNFVIFVWFHNRKLLDDCKIFVVPAKRVNRDVLKSHLFWHSHKRRDGLARKNTGHVAIWWTGNDTPKSLSRGYARKWKIYEDNWAQLTRR